MSTVRVLSLKQPWASLVVRGVKRFESRRWPPRRRGRMAIHQCQRVVSEAHWNAVVSDEAVQRVVATAGLRSYDDVAARPRLHIAGSAQVDDVRVMAHWGDAELDAADLTFSSWRSSDVLWRMTEPEECTIIGRVEAMPGLWFLEGDPVPGLTRARRTAPGRRGRVCDDREAEEGRDDWEQAADTARTFVDRLVRVPEHL